MKSLMFLLRRLSWKNCLHLVFTKKVFNENLSVLENYLRDFSKKLAETSTCSSASTNSVFTKGLIARLSSEECLRVDNNGKAIESTPRGL